MTVPRSDFAPRVLDERRRLAVEDPKGELEAVHPIDPIAESVAWIAKSKARVDRLASGTFHAELLQDLQAADPTGIDAVDLLALDLAPLQWIVPDLIPEGTTVIASPPKIGKSCLVYQIAAEVALGGDFLGRPVQAGAVLYLALEDGQRRGQDRLRAALKGRTPARGQLRVQWSAKRIGSGLEDDIRYWLDAHPDDARLVAIDTLQKVRPASSGRRGAYEVDVEDLGRLQELFRDRPAALVIVHHSRKEAGDDFLASVSGTYGITGSVDTIVVLRRKRQEAFGSIHVTGREVPDGEIPVRFEDLIWHEAPQALSAASFERAEVYRIIDTSGPIFPAAIAIQLGIERTSVQHMVGKLVESGAVARTTGGYVVTRSLTSIPDHSDHSESDWSDGRYKDDGYGPGATDLDPEPAG